MNEIDRESADSAAILKRLLDMARRFVLAEMASSVAHELNQPLGAIATFAQAGDRLLNRPEPKITQALDVFRQINTEALGAGEGIRRIRRLFRPEEINHVPCRMSDVVAEVQPVFDMMAQWSAVGFRADVPPLLPEVSVDRLQVQHVLFSLFQNGLDASVANSLEPTVTLSARADRYAVEVSVIDSGTGISADVTKQVFQPFFSTKPRGTGLGLASSRAIIEAHEGTIGFERVAQGGTRFWFRLPIREN